MSFDDFFNPEDDYHIESLPDGSILCHLCDVPIPPCELESSALVAPHQIPFGLIRPLVICQRCAIWLRLQRDNCPELSIFGARVARHCDASTALDKLVVAAGPQPPHPGKIPP